MLTEDTFATTLTEIETFLNNRSITDVSIDITEIDAVTPKHFLLGRGHINVPPRHKTSHLQRKMEVRTTERRSCLDPLDQGTAADTSNHTKMAQAHSTSEGWHGQTVWFLKDRTTIFGQLDDTEQPRQYSVKTKTGTFKIKPILLAPKEAEESLHHDEDEEQAKTITQEARTQPSKDQIDSTTNNRTAKTAFA